MTWADELTKIRRYLRDPDGNIWSDGLLMDLWNEVSADLQNRTNLLEDIASISVPPRYQQSYTHDWEVQFIASGETAYRCFRNQGNSYSFTSRFEAQIYAGIGSDGSDEGRAFTHPWEAWVKTDVGAEVPFPLPNSFHRMKWISYDKDPLSITTRRRVQDTGSSWVLSTGTPQVYYHMDEFENQIVLWPRPTTADWQDVTGSGMLTHISGDTNAVDTGTIIRRTGTFLSADRGIAVNAIESADNVLISFDVSPTEVTSQGSAIDWPPFLTKYVRYGVLQRAYAANTDGRIPSLGAYWKDRYLLGIQVLKQFRARRYQRIRRLGPTIRLRRSMRPRLPDTYPAV